MSKNLSIKIQTVRQQIHSFCLRLWENVLSGKGWTFGFLLWVGLIVTSFLFFTVHFRPLKQVMKPSHRVHHVITLWIDYGFFKLGGLGFSESPEVNPKALVYVSRPPAYLYPLYLMNFLNYRVKGEKFNLSMYVLYSQAILWVSATCIGFLGVRLAKRLSVSPLSALAGGITGQIIFHTFPYNLEKYFEPMPEQFICLFLVCLLVIEELAVEKSHYQKLQILRGLCIFLLVYFDKGISVPGLGTYFLARMLINKLQLKKIAQLVIPIFLAIAFHGIQLMWVKQKFSEISFVGASFLWRSGLDGAINYVGILTPDKLGAGNIFLRNVGVLSIVIILWCFFRGGQRLLKYPLILVFTAIGFYVVPGYLFNQSIMIHPYVYDIFLALASILAFCYVLVPYLESKTGNTGILIWILVIVGFCLCMYQLRVFAVAHPLPIPEPDWRLYRYFG